MPTETNFSIQWLEDRFPFDIAARNKTVENACLHYCQNKETLRIVDIGSGTGSNGLYFFEKFPQTQEWTFIELNKELLEAAFARIKTWADEKGYPSSRDGLAMQLELPGREVQIKGLNTSFLELQKVIDLHQVDLVTAGAVFDLLTQEMFQSITDQLIFHQVGLLATLNFTDQRFQPSLSGDEQYIRLYKEHMLRPQAFGQSMGPDCYEQMTRYYEKSELDWVGGKSEWEIGPGDTTMHVHVLNFMENSVPEMLTDELDDFGEWIAKKKQLVHAQQLSTYVSHYDIFVKPPTHQDL